MAEASLSRSHPAPALPLGRAFVSPLFDLLLIGGGLTLPLLAWLLWAPESAGEVSRRAMPFAALLVTQAHFAASTVRLYTKPGAFQSFPFLTMVLPVLTFAVLTGFVAFAQDWGWHLFTLYASWSPFHYAAQTFGLASMYCFRSGCQLDSGERRLLRATCLMPFLWSFLAGTPTGVGLGWFVPMSALSSQPWLLQLWQDAVDATRILTFAAPLGLWLWIARRSRASEPGREARPGLPLVSLLLIVTNGIWWVVFNDDYFNAFIWATIFHGLQYLAVVAIFHVREQTARPGNRHGRSWHVATLYAACVGLGYLLFQCWPLFYVPLGWGRTESLYLVVAMINIHHFVVDAFIWRVRGDSRNRQVVAST